MPATRRLLALTLALACKPADGDDTAASTTEAATTDSDTDTTSDTPTTGAPAAPCPDHTTPDDCCCFQYDGNFIDVVCTAEALCSTMLGTCNSEDYSDCAPDDASAEAAVDCMLDALRADEPGAVRWTLTDPEYPGENDRFVVVYTSGTGDLFWTGEDYFGLATDVLGAQRYSLAALGLDACAAEPTATARFECLRTAFTDPAEVCVEPHLVTSP